MFACLNASCRSCLLALYARYQLMPWPDFQSSKGLKSPSGKFPFLSGEAPEHETDHCETDERGRLASVTLVVACQPTTAADPAKVRSTIHLFGSTTNRCRSQRRTI